jgi:hypothetical protein
MKQALSRASPENNEKTHEISLTVFTRLSAVALFKGLSTWAELSRFAKLSRLSELTFELRLHAPR